VLAAVQILIIMSSWLLLQSRKLPLSKEQAVCLTQVSCLPYCPCTV
jgi:hypothetical protein